MNNLEFPKESSNAGKNGGMINGDRRINYGGYKYIEGKNKL